MRDVMLDEAEMWLDEPLQRERKLESSAIHSPPASPGDEDSDDSDDDDVDPVAAEKYRRQVIESGGFDVDLFFQPFGGIIPCGSTPYDILFGKVGLHCYNIDEGKNLEFKKVKKVNAEIASIVNFYITLEAVDPVDDSVVTFQTSVMDAVLKNQARLRMFTNTCRIKPLVPGTGPESFAWYPDDDVDESYKGDLPDWLQTYQITAENKLQFYEVKEWELQDNKWLYLYAEFALFSEWDFDLSPYLPLEINSVVVQTKEDVEPSMKLKSKNAVFYISFKARDGPKCRGIIRKTSDGRPGHIFLEARCWIDK